MTSRNGDEYCGYGFAMKNGASNSTEKAVSESSPDEISLIDLLRVLFEHRRVVVVVLLSFTITGLIYALLFPMQYRYSTTIEIGTIMEDGKTMLIDQPQTLLAKINEAYIPYAISQFTADRVRDYKITARIPPGSEVVVLESKAPEDKGDTIISLHKQVVEYVKSNHQGVFDIIKKEMNVELDKSKNKLSALQDRHKVLVADLKRLDQTAALLNAQIEELKALVADAISYRKMARSQTGDETQAMTLLMIDNEIQQNNQRLAALEERLHIDLPREKDSLNNLISDNSREQQEQTAEIAKIQAAVNNMRETRMLIAPMRSGDPVGIGRTTIVLASAVAGVFAGIFAAFMMALVGKIKEELEVGDGGSG